MARSVRRQLDGALELAPGARHLAASRWTSSRATRPSRSFQTAYVAACGNTLPILGRFSLTIPEPASAWLLVTGLAGLVIARRTRRR